MLKKYLIKNNLKQNSHRKMFNRMLRMSNRQKKHIELLRILVVVVRKSSSLMKEWCQWCNH